MLGILYFLKKNQKHFYLCTPPKKRHDFWSIYFFAHRPVLVRRFWKREKHLLWLWRNVVFSEWASLCVIWRENFAHPTRLCVKTRSSSRELIDVQLLYDERRFQKLNHDARHKKSRFTGAKTCNFSWSMCDVFCWKSFNWKIVANSTTRRNLENGRNSSLSLTVRNNWTTCFQSLELLWLGTERTQQAAGRSSNCGKQTLNLLSPMWWKSPVFLWLIDADRIG